MKLENLLNDGEKRKVNIFLLDEEMKQAIKKVLLATIYANGTLKPGEDPDFLRNAFLGLLIAPNGQEYNLDNPQLGAKLRARIEGLILLEDGFKQLDKFKEGVTIEVDGENPAR